MRIFGVILFACVLFGFSERKVRPEKEWLIPQQRFNPWSEMGMKRIDTLDVREFTMTSQVTLGEYRKYLDAVKLDSSAAFYRSQLPDSTMCTSLAYQKYMQPGTYDAFPVCGVTWLSAMNYCKWKSAQDHLPDSMEYRLPNLEEWIAAYRFLQNEKVRHDMNRNYSDWLLNAFDESSYDFVPDGYFSYTYDERPGDPPVLKRKRFIGNSFHFQHEQLGGFLSEYGYSFRGYSYVTFRMVKVNKNRQPSKQNRVKTIPKK